LIHFYKRKAEEESTLTENPQDAAVAGSWTTGYCC